MWWPTPVKAGLCKSECVHRAAPTNNWNEMPSANLKISSTEHKTNEWICVADYRWHDRPRHPVLLGIKKLLWYGHVSRYNKISKELLQGTVEWKRRRAMPKKMWLGSIKYGIRLTVTTSWLNSGPGPMEKGHDWSIRLYTPTIVSLKRVMMVMLWFFRPDCFLERPATWHNIGIIHPAAGRSSPMLPLVSFFPVTRLIVLVGRCFPLLLTPCTCLPCCRCWLGHVLHIIHRLHLL